MKLEQIGEKGSTHRIYKRANDEWTELECYTTKRRAKIELPSKGWFHCPYCNTKVEY